ncbi:hypothetical protein D6T64_05440 [Cryobacterium melibiosiphilum]|uniref:Uncharacterized protein n=1 Tax=Cryobacterium melibiosiphilum TaxID=995039 RepID=A0A3A5MS48_9MICO|nr:hypothetical protein [Cryobacterium melibiosiphilum]RJT89903.1 hypothetical protein D6T64_05440 [Cryobacterium melibiosiphilum]
MALLVEAAVWLSPADRRSVRREQWTADIALAKTEGLSPMLFAVGALTTSLVGWRSRLTPHLMVAASCLTIAGFTLLGASTLSQGGYQATTTYFSSQQQADAERIVAEFTATNTAPLPEDSRAGESFEEQTAQYWQDVPWRAVAEQWDCKVTLDARVTHTHTEVGHATVTLESGQICADTSGVAAEGAATVLPKAVYLATAAASAQ